MFYIFSRLLTKFVVKLIILCILPTEFFKINMKFKVKEDQRKEDQFQEKSVVF